jgi:dipeptidase D
MESVDIAHGPLEFVFTVEEETGLIGASEFPGGLLRSQYFLNLDNEETGTLCIGCSGGINTTARRKATLRAARAGAAWRVKVSGLKGGHSGVDIHRGRGNALRVLGRLLQDLRGALQVEIADLKGGSARNAIPRDASAVVLADGSKEAELKKLLAGFEADVRSELGEFDPGVQVRVEKAERPAQVLDDGDAEAAVALLTGLPHGVLEMSPDIPGLTQTSTNLATAGLREGAIEIGTNQRSAIASAKQRAARMVATLCRLAGFETQHGADYPGWKPDPNSEIVRKLQEVHQEIFGGPAKLIAMHAGLECGVIGEKYAGMQMVSFGPQIVDVHSPHERVQISTVESFWTYLCKVLERL